MARPRVPAVVLFLLGVLAACSPEPLPPPAESCSATLPDDGDCSTAAPSYATDVVPLVQAHCLDCHFSGNRYSKVVLETQAQIQSNSRTAETALYRCDMPPADGTPLGNDDREVLLKWLVCGAPNN